MSTTVNIHDAKTHFSSLIERALNGEEIIVAKAGKPIIMLVPIGEKAKVRPMGMDKGKVIIGPNFDDPLPEFEEYM